MSSSEDLNNLIDEIDEGIASGEALLDNTKSTVKRNKSSPHQSTPMTDSEMDAALQEVAGFVDEFKSINRSPHARAEHELATLLKQLEPSQNTHHIPSKKGTKKNMRQSFRHYKRYAIGAIMTFVSTAMLAYYKFAPSPPPPPTGLKAYLDASIQSTTDVINALPQVAAQLQHYVPSAHVLGLLAILVSALGLVRYWPVIKQTYTKLISKRNRRRPVPIRSKSHKSRKFKQN